MIASKLRFHVYPYHQVPIDYDVLYLSIFGDPDPTHLPATILIGEDANDEIVGMLAVYVHNKNTVYIQAAGFLPGKQNRPMSLLWLHQAIDFLHESAENITASISGENTQALRLVLKAGFKIKGGEISTDGDYMVKVIHQKERK